METRLIFFYFLASMSKATLNIRVQLSIAFCMCGSFLFFDWDMTDT